MTIALSGTLVRSFRESAAAAYRDLLLRHQQGEARRREQDEVRQRDTVDDTDFAIAVVSIAEAAEFRITLDRYDTGTVAALERNEIELVRARERLEDILGKAHVLPDGRRVFKTEDGLRVFDERGIELSAEDILPDEIADERPRWEVAKEAIDRVDELTAERAEILEYQHKLDAARERLDAGDLTRAEFDQLRSDLAADMPDAVRDQMPELAGKPTIEAAADGMDLELEISDDMVPSSAAAKSFIPG